MSDQGPGVDGMSSLGPGTSVLAFDVGGTDIKAALIDNSGVIREFTHVGTPSRGPDVALKNAVSVGIPLVDAVTAVTTTPA